MTRAEAAALTLLARACASTTPVRVEAEPVGALEPDEHLARAVARLGLLRLAGDIDAPGTPLFVTPSRHGERHLEGVRLLLLDGLGGALAAERPAG